MLKNRSRQKNWIESGNGGNVLSFPGSQVKFFGLFTIQKTGWAERLFATNGKRRWHRQIIFQLQHFTGLRFSLICASFIFANSRDVYDYITWRSRAHANHITYKNSYNLPKFWVGWIFEALERKGRVRGGPGRAGDEYRFASTQCFNIFGNISYFQQTIFIGKDGMGKGKLFRCIGTQNDCAKFKYADGSYTPKTTMLVKKGEITGCIFCICIIVIHIYGENQNTDYVCNTVYGYFGIVIWKMDNTKGIHQYS